MSLKQYTFLWEATSMNVSAEWMQISLKNIT